MRTGDEKPGQSDRFHGAEVEEPDSWKGLGREFQSLEPWQQKASETSSGVWMKLEDRSPSEVVMEN